MKFLGTVTRDVLQRVDTGDVSGAQATKMLLVMNYGNVQTYAGTVSNAEKNRRRAKNRVARKSRRMNRGK